MLQRGVNFAISKIEKYMSAPVEHVRVSPNPLQIVFR